MMKQPLPIIRVLLIIFLGSALGRASDSTPGGLFFGNSPQPIAVARREAWKYAEQIAALHDGSFVVRGDGASMAPLYPSGTVLVIARVSFDQLQRGATVIYRNDEGRPIAHVLVSLSRKGWRTAGLNNPHLDEGSVSPENLLGMVTSAYTPVDLPTLNSVHYVAQ
jgi:phage repressor protein C with HTH and peptisase S24 domain